MKNIIAFSLILIFLLPFFSCGKKGDLLPPLIRFPQPAEDVEVVQKADQIVLSWRNPVAYEDGSTLSIIEKIEIWILEEMAAEETDSAETPVEGFEQTAKLLATIPGDRILELSDQEGFEQGMMFYSYDLSGKESLSKKYTFGIRVKDKKRYSRFSVSMPLKPMVLPLPPSEVKLLVSPDKIEITWSPPQENRDHSFPANVKGYNIYRSEGEENPLRLNADLIKQEKYEDKNFLFEQEYTYVVRASATDKSPYLESEDSEKTAIVPEDTFAPEPPEGLISVAGQDVLAISWDANTEEDLEGYRVWRREEGETEFRLLTQGPIRNNAYNDRQVEKGKEYAYAVTALDFSGNESQRSKTVSDRIRERMR
jgi:hypothetical protein